MPNGEAVNHQYVDTWCHQQHAKIDNMLERLDKRIWWLIGIAFTNLGTLIIGGIVAVVKIELGA